MKLIMLVDDEDALVAALSLMLTGAGYNVISAQSGEDALILLKDQKPDVIFLDIMLAGLSGIEVIRVIKSHPDYRSIPVVMMSGARPLIRQKDLMWEEFLYKPFQVQKVLEILQKIFVRNES
jgi:CheY-like chemotaxis protein